MMKYDLVICRQKLIVLLSWNLLLLLLQHFRWATWH